MGAIGQLCLVLSSRSAPKEAHWRHGEQQLTVSQSPVAPNHEPWLFRSCCARRNRGQGGLCKASGKAAPRLFRGRRYITWAMQESCRWMVAGSGARPWNHGNSIHSSASTPLWHRMRKAIDSWGSNAPRGEENRKTHKPVSLPEESGPRRPGAFQCSLFRERCHGDAFCMLAFLPGHLSQLPPWRHGEASRHVARTECGLLLALTRGRLHSGWHSQTAS